jgi:recombination protein RecT
MTTATPETTALVVRQAKDFEPYLIDRKAELDAYLAGSDVSTERFIKATILALARYPDIQKAPVKDVLLAVLSTAEMGLEPTGAYGGAHLIRYGEKVNVLVDYRGFVKMALRSGQVHSVSADLVYAGDEFSYERGTNPRIVHIPTLSDAKRGTVTHIYAIAVLNAGGSEFVVMTKTEVEAIRTRSRAGSTGPWVSDWGEMAKKTAVRRLFKLIPVAITPQLATALDREDQDADEKPTAAAPVDPSRRSLLSRLGVADAADTPMAAEDVTAEGTHPSRPETVDDGLPEMKL